MEASSGSSMLLLNGLPARTQISLDGHAEAYLINAEFAGVKGLPAGWHCISWSITASDRPLQDVGTSNSASPAGPMEGSVRNVILRYFDEGEVAARELDRVQQRLVTPDQQTSADNSIGRSRHRNITRNFDPSSTIAVSTIVTPDVLSNVEPRLLPYPSEAEAPWRSATRHLSHKRGLVGRKVIAKVLGVDSSSGDSTTDSLATGPSRARDAKESIQLTGNLGRQEGGKVIWGKSRPDTEPSLEAFEVEVDEDTPTPTHLDSAELKKRKRNEQTDPPAGSEDDESLLFTSFNLRRSWPPNSVGADITRWSEDKSWLLQEVADPSRLGISLSDRESEWYHPLLCEFELSFILFITANNHYAWEQWKELLTLFCRSSSLLGAQSTFYLHPSTLPSHPSHHITDQMIRLDAHIAILTTLQAQLALLDADFWSTQTTPTEEQAVLKQLDVLRANIARSLSSQHSSNSELQQEQEKLVSAWRKLSHFTTGKFGWRLDRRLDEEAEVEDDLDAEVGEDAPVVVEM